MAFKMNTVKADLCSYPPYMLLAVRKFGKSTFWRDLVIEAWGDASKGLMISCGTEEGYHALDNLQVEPAMAWNEDYDEELDRRGLVQIIDDVIDNNAEYGIKGVCFDTLDTMCDIAIAEVMRMSKRDTGKVCKSINDAFGGYGRGLDKVIEIMKEQIARLRAAGIAVFIISHVKMKEKSDMMTGDKYEVLTNNLMDKVYTAIADNAQMVMMGVLERDINSGRIESERRVLYLRGTSLVDAGSRFLDLPEKVDFTPAAFLDAFRTGVKNSATTKHMSDSEMNAAAKVEAANAEKQAEIARQKDKKQREDEAMEPHRDEYLEKIQSGFKDASADVKAAAKSLKDGAGCTKFSDPEMPIATLKAIADLF